MNNNYLLQIEMDKRWGNRDVKAELGYCSQYIKDRKNITNYDLEFYMWLFGAALDMIHKLEGQQ